jgi:hypothetical protein
VKAIKLNKKLAKMETTTITKAEALRIKQATETLTNLLNAKLIDFRERFLKSYVEYRFNEIKREISGLKKEKFDITKYKQAHHAPTEERFYSSIASKVIQLENELLLHYSNTLKFITEANENYNTKFVRLVNELVKHGVRSYPLTIEKISSGSTEYDFNFLITHSTTIKTVQVYARIIFAEGEINAPHYRFIITANKNVLHS